VGLAGRVGDPRVVPRPGRGVGGERGDQSDGAAVRPAESDEQGHNVMHLVGQVVALRGQQRIAVDLVAAVGRFERIRQPGEEHRWATPTGQDAEDAAEHWRRPKTDNHLAVPPSAKSEE